MRDWFPVSDFGIFAHLCDVLNPDAHLGSLFQETHPNRGIFSPLLVDTNQKQAIPIPLSLTWNNSWGTLLKSRTLEGDRQH